MIIWLVILILSSILFSLILHALQERKNKRKMQAEIKIFQQKVAEIKMKELFAEAEKEAIKNKIAVLEKQNAKLQEKLNNARQNIKRRKRQLEELKD